MKLTIYTPTYNRKNFLKRVYQSLQKQTRKDFVWLIIDDGSNDGTEDLIKIWINLEKDFLIKYLKKKNEGVHSARDMAYETCETDLIFSVDSDDWLFEDAVEKIMKCWESVDNTHYAGIFARSLFIDENEDELVNDFPKIYSATFQEFTYKYKYKKDKETIIRSDIIKKIPKSPIFNNEKLVGESYKWIQLPNDKPFLIMQEPVTYTERQDEGYTKNAYSVIFKNPRGFRENYKQHIISSIFIVPKMKGYLGYISCSLILKDKFFIQNSPRPLITFLLFPFGIISYIYFVLRNKYAKI